MDERERERERERQRQRQRQKRDTHRQRVYLVPPNLHSLLVSLHLHILLLFLSICILSINKINITLNLETPALPSSPSFSKTARPPGCRSSPTILSGSFKSLSMTVTRRPSRASTVAKAEPATPDPMITISGSLPVNCLLGVFFTLLDWNKKGTLIREHWNINDFSWSRQL